MSALSAIQYNVVIIMKYIINNNENILIYVNNVM